MTLAEPTTTGGGILGAAGSRETYVRNLTALWRWDPKLAAAIEAVHPDDLPAVEIAKDGAATVRVSAGEGANSERTSSLLGDPRFARDAMAPGRSVYLHSKYKPLAEAEAWAASVPVDDKYVVVVGGFGLGHHVKALFERLPVDAIVVIAEPSLAILRAAMESVDCSEILRSGRAIFFTAANRSEIVERLEMRAALFVSGMQFAVHAPSLQIAGPFHTDFQKVIAEFIAYTRTGLLTLMLNNVATCRNIANNLGRYVTTPAIE